MPAAHASLFIPSQSNYTVKTQIELDKRRKQSRAQVALVALILFFFGVGGLWALSNQLVQSAKNQAWSPLAVSSVVGSPYLFVGDFYSDSVVFHVSNQGTAPIVIRGATASGAQSLYYGVRREGNFGHPVVDDNGCSYGECDIYLAPGEGIDFQIQMESGTLCNRDFVIGDPYSPPSINSVRKVASSTLTFKYQYSNALPAPAADSANALVGGKGTSPAAQPNTGAIRTLTVPVSMECFDYWLCEGDPYWNTQCISKYETNKAHWCVKGGCGYSFVG